MSLLARPLRYSVAGARIESSHPPEHKVILHQSENAAAERIITALALGTASNSTALRTPATFR